MQVEKPEQIVLGRQNDGLQHRARLFQPAHDTAEGGGDSRIDMAARRLVPDAQPQPAEVGWRDGIDRREGQRVLVPVPEVSARHHLQHKLRVGDGSRHRADMRHRAEGAGGIGPARG